MKTPDRETVSRLDALPNIGKAISTDLAKINITHPKDLIGKDAYKLHVTLCKVLGHHQDNCVIDVFLSAINYMEGGEALPWWHFTEARKCKLKPEF